MPFLTRYIYTFAIGIIFLFSLITDFYNELSITLFVIQLLMLVNKMGKGIVLREVTAVLYSFTCLVMPVVGYAYYTIDNRLSQLWVKYMPVSESVYFGFTLPAITIFCLALTFPFPANRDTEQKEGLQNLIARIKKVLENHKKTCFIIIGAGILSSFIAPFLPSSLRYVCTLFFLSSFAGFLYVYYLPHFKFKTWVLILFTIFILNNALNSGMFTIVAYMGVTLFSFFVVGIRVHLWKKILVLLLASFFILVLQNAKRNFRMITWSKNYEGSKAVLMSEFFLMNLQKGDQLIEKDAFFSTYVRVNQGYNVARVIKRIPSVQPYDNGQNLLLNFTSALVPRFMWPDKPEAGGKFNMKYYAGINIKNWSTNIGPLGEAYGSFGVEGGILFMFFLGLFIRYAYKKIFTIAEKMPLIICWIPVLFYQITYSAETDTLAIFNSLFKSAFFIWLLVKILPRWFGISKKADNYLPAMPGAYN